MTFTTAVDALETLARGGRVRSLLDIYATLSMNIAMLAPLGLVLTLLWDNASAAVVLLAVPVAVMHVSMKSVRSIVDEAQLAIETMMSALEERDAYTAGHSERVGRFAALIATHLDLAEEEVRRVANAGRIHDIGKIDIPDAILRKTCCLDDHEYGIMKTHTDRPMEYAQKYPKLGRHIPFFEAACHHEKFDGSGYIHGLQGEQIPLAARIISVADTWDAMTSDRPYRNGLLDSEAIRRLADAAGTQFDPRVVEAFMRAYAGGEITRVMVEWKEAERFRAARREAEVLPRSA
jgi:HD-GYP domain-containing protein (c-di-GMP phosphodiesterase class II)